MKNFKRSVWLLIVSCIGFAALIFSVTYSQTEEGLDLFIFLPLIQQDVSDLSNPANSTPLPTPSETSTLILNLTVTPTSSTVPSKTPTNTSTPTLTPTPTKTFVPTPTFYPNPNFITKLISVGYDQSAADHNSLMSAISADGRFIAFQSFASNIVSDDTNESSDMFVFDLHSGNTQRVSISSDGIEGNDRSFEPAISYFGRYVAFQSYATNLVISDTNDSPDIFIYDRILDETRLVSREQEGNKTKNLTTQPSISDDGQITSYLSVVSDAVFNDHGGFSIGWYDDESKTSQFLTLGQDATKFGPITNFSMSANGRFFAFQSKDIFVNQLVNSGKANTIFVYDHEGEIVIPASLPSYNPENYNFENLRPDPGIPYLVSANDHSTNPAISADGTFIAFESLATNLVPDYVNAGPGIFTHNTKTGQTNFIAAGTDPSMSADGRFILYHFDDQVYVYDHEGDQAWQVSVNDEGESANGVTINGKISADGNFISFVSNATNLSADIETGGKWNIYVHQRQGEKHTLPMPEVTTTPTPTYTVTPYESVTPNPAERCPVRIQGQLIEGMRILEFTGDRYIGNFHSNGVYSITVRDLTNGEIIASEIPMMPIPVTFTGEHGCTNGNEGYAALDLAAEADYYINPAYADGIPGNIQLLVAHENNTVDDQFVLTAAQATATVFVPTLTPLPTNTPTPVVAGPNSLLGTVHALYNEFLPQAGATVYLIEQPQSGESGTVIDQTNTDENGSYAFHNVPLLTNGDSYMIVSCFELDDDTKYAGSLSVILPDPTKPKANLNIYMIPSQLECIPPQPPVHRQKSVKQITIGLNGEPPNGSSSYPSMSADGKRIVFHSEASNLTEGDTNNSFDVFLYDALSEQLKLISISNEGTQSNGASTNPKISADGRFVMFQSGATNLSSTATANGIKNLYLYDVTNDSLSLFTKNQAGEQANGNSYDFELSADGNYITFTSEATNLTGDDYANNTPRIFLLDRSSNHISLITKPVSSEPVTRPSSNPDITRDGRFIVFRSFSSNLTTDDSNGQYDIFLHDRESGVTKKISKHRDGTQGNSNSSNPRFSEDGQFVFFISNASTLVDSDTNNLSDIFKFSIEQNSLSRVLIDTAQLQPDYSSAFTSTPFDSRFILFSSHATNLVSGDTNQKSDIFFHDSITGKIRRLSLTASGSESNGASYAPSISDDYKTVTFASYASNLLQDAEEAYWLNVFIYQYE